METFLNTLKFNVLYFSPFIASDVLPLQTQKIENTQNNINWQAAYFCFCSLKKSQPVARELHLQYLAYRTSQTLGTAGTEETVFTMVKKDTKHDQTRTYLLYLPLKEFL